MTPRLHLPGLVSAPEAEVTIEGPALRHLRALRLRAGDQLVVFDGHGAERLVEVTALGPRGASVRVLDARIVARESPLTLVLCPALLKGSKMDFVVEKATELGVQRIAPVVTRHGIGQRADVARWARLAAAAAMQSGRARVPQIDAPAPLATRLAEAWPGDRLLCWEDEASTRLSHQGAAASHVVVLIGPEGGFAADEVTLARTHGFVTIGFGPRILRAETAAIVAVALVQHRWGDG